MFNVLKNLLEQLSILGEGYEISKKMGNSRELIFQKTNGGN